MFVRSQRSTSRLGVTLTFITAATIFGLPAQQVTASAHSSCASMSTGDGFVDTIKDLRSVLDDCVAEAMNSSPNDLSANLIEAYDKCGLKDPLSGPEIDLAVLDIDDLLDILAQDPPGDLDPLLAIELELTLLEMRLELRPQQ